jgi:hypothetical protein
MPEFNGTITVKENPVSNWETFSHTFENSIDEKDAGFYDLTMTQRAESGYHRASFSIRGPYESLATFMENALGREVKIHGNDGKLVWEGYIHEMEYDIGRAVYTIDLGEMSNAVWVRYRVRGSSTTSRSATQTNADSIAKYGRREFVLSGGELESTDIADAVAQQYLDLHSWPRPSPTRIDPEKDIAEYPIIKVDCRGWFDTLNWCTYNQTVSTDNQGASQQVATILADTDVAQFVSATELSINATLVSKEYDADRRGGDILRDIARLGDSSNRRWRAYMDKGRIFHYDRTAPPEDQT